MPRLTDLPIRNPAQALEPNTVEERDVSLEHSQDKE